MPVNILIIASSSFMLALSGAVVPGPLFTMTVSESFKRGFSAGPLIIIGHALAEIAVVVLLLSGAAPLLSHEKAQSVIGIGGGVILCVMGLALLKTASRAQLVMSAAGRQTGLHPVLTGVLGSISNPYWVMWWITIGLGFLLSAARYGLPGIVAFFTGHIAADFLWYSLVSFSASRGRTSMGIKGYRFLLYSCGFFLVCFGGWFIFASMS